MLTTLLEMMAPYRFNVSINKTSHSILTCFAKRMNTRTTFSVIDLQRHLKDNAYLALITEPS